LSVLAGPDVLEPPLAFEPPEPGDPPAADVVLLPVDDVVLDDVLGEPP
jgi:hypothetical protein